MRKKTKTTKTNPKAPKVSFETDLQVLNDCIEEDKLEVAVSQLDPQNIEKSFAKVPLEVIRLLTVLFSSEEKERQILTLKPDEREPLS